ncbi:MAG: glycosyltransferase family 4 protein [Candidatus Eisenbacteria bacterium]|nr:glycosyltransferase family 4 protein [Candidatus Eisenbacteria bacterium]
MKILAINWRDIANPEAGGAEVHIHEILKRFVTWGHEVTLLASGFPDCREEVRIDGIRVIRKGRWHNANLALPIYYVMKLKNERFDIVLEDINKIPFFSPLYAKSRVVATVPHLFGSTVFKETSPILAMYVYLHELLIPLVYAKVPFVAISESTRDDLVRRGVNRHRISVIHCGLDHALYSDSSTIAKSKKALLVYLGRLRKYKGVQYLLKAMLLVKERVPDARLVVVGNGPYKGPLVELSEKLGVLDIVSFVGQVPSDEKVRLLREAHLVVNPSPKEGWGLTVLEANACGTPVVASRSPGLIDSVRDGVSGILVEHGNIRELADAMIRIIEDKELSAKLSKGAKEWSLTFNWDTCAKEMEKFLLGALR